MVLSNLCALMECKKKTIRSLARETGLATLTITRARDGRIVECRLSTLEVIARALGCGIKDLFEEKTEVKKLVYPAAADADAEPAPIAWAAEEQAAFMPAGRDQKK